MTGTAQTRVVPLWCEVVALIYDVVLYVHASLSCRGGEKGGVSTRVGNDKTCDGGKKWAPTPLAEEGELLVAVLGVPAVKTPLVHAFDLKALQLGAEDAVLVWGGLSEIGQAFRRQKNLH